MAYLVHHTLNRNGTYTGGKRNLLPFDENLSLINRSTKRAQRLANQHFFPFKTSGRKCDFEYPIHGTSIVVKLKARILVGYFPYFDQKSYIMTFSENKF